MFLLTLAVVLAALAAGIPLYLEPRAKKNPSG
jgi:hypothetical protein